MNLIILDYDQTFTSNKELWVKVIPILQSFYTVICCTYRFGLFPIDNDVKNDMEALNVKIIYAGNYKDKWSALIQNNYDIENAIWIDDQPQLIKLFNENGIKTNV